MNAGATDASSAGRPSRRAEMAILVNSSDGFRDCWQPFFRLFETYWPSCRFPIYLNVEAMSYVHPTLPIRCLEHPADASGERMPWSDRLLRSLAAIPERCVLVMQEDYFLDAPVRGEIVEDCLRLVAGGDVGCIHLTHFGARRGSRRAELPYLVDVPRISLYRVSTQAAIWDKQVLASYLRRDETVWETELLGTMRSWYAHAPIRSVGARTLADGAAMSYTGTGIIRGRWHPAMPSLFERHGIALDYSRRGFHDFPSRWRTRFRMLVSLLRRPCRTLSALMGA